MAAPRRVVVTGIGVVSPFGIGAEAAWSGLLQGRDCSEPVRGIDPLGLRGLRACQVPDESLREASREAPRWADRATRLLLAALGEALSFSGDLAPAACRLRLVLGTTLGGMEAGMAYHREALSGRRGRVVHLLDYLASAQPATLATAAGRKLAPWVISNACASGTSALGVGFRLVKAGREPAVLAAGCDPMSAFTFWGFNALRLVAPDRCRPFDRNRSGLILGEGAAVFVLEERERAVARGARVLGEVLGYGETNDAHHPTHPHPAGEGARRAMEAALGEACVRPEELGYVNAHGTGTAANDDAEARALSDLLGEAAARVPISSTKGHVGHCLGAAGALEAAFTLLSLTSGVLPQTLNLEEPDPTVPLRHIIGVPLPRPTAVALSNSFGFGGMNASIVLAAPKGAVRGEQQ